MTGGWGTPSWQGGAVGLGDVFVSDKSPAMARALLAACDELEVDRIEVRTVTNGFIVPEAVWEATQTAIADREGWAF